MTPTFPYYRIEAERQTCETKAKGYYRSIKSAKRDARKIDARSVRVVGCISIAQARTAPVGSRPAVWVR